jgi:hypothetical protein
MELFDDSGSRPMSDDPFNLANAQQCQAPKFHRVGVTETKGLCSVKTEEMPRMLV